VVQEQLLVLHALREVVEHRSVPQGGRHLVPGEFRKSLDVER
jgi:hypothetical protein